MKVTYLDTLEGIFDAICDGNKVFCIDMDYPNAYLANSMKICEIVEYLDNRREYIFISVEE